jgi:uncharacterized OB-fold protein
MSATEIVELRPMPVPSALSRPFWDAAATGRLCIQQCSVCGRYEWTPIDACSACLTETLDWQQVSGRGSLYSYSIVHRPQSPGFEVPYIVAIVELDEGVRMLTDLIDTDGADIAIGMPVEVSFDTSAPMPLYHFRPSGGAR